MRRCRTDWHAHAAHVVRPTRPGLKLKKAFLCPGRKRSYHGKDWMGLTMIKLAAIWDPKLRPSKWTWIRLSPGTSRIKIADNEAYLYAVTYAPSGWTLAREDRVEAEVYVPL